MYPLKMQPVFKEMLWGGHLLRDHFGKDIPSDGTGESWEVSCHKAGESQIANGAYAGRTLASLAREMGEALLGSFVCGRHGDTFPLLVKFIDAKQSLSVQVHPNDADAARLEGDELGKTEMWVVLAAEPGAQLIYGFDRAVTREEFADAIRAGTLEGLLNYVDVKPGDAFLIRAGTLHAIGAGLLICEIQQSSNATYRVYDFNRVDAEGKPRELHVDKALEVTQLTSPKGSEYADIGAGVTCEYFTTKAHTVETSMGFAVDPARFEVIICTSGQGGVNGEPMRAGDTFLLPAHIGSYTVAGSCKIIRTFVTC